MKYLCIALIKFYRKFISPLKPPTCRFTPTCSQYALEAFTVHGFYFAVIRSVRQGMTPCPRKSRRINKRLKKLKGSSQEV